MTCANCGSDIGVGLNFCSRCGAAAPPPPQTSAPLPVVNAPVAQPQTAPPPLGVSTAPEPLPTCAICGIPLGAPERAMGVCRACLEVARVRPFPGWVKGTAAVTVLLVLVSLGQAGKGIKAGVEMERGRAAEERAAYREAAAHYQVVLDRFPGSQKARMRLGVALHHAGDDRGAVEALAPLEGKDAGDSETAAEVNRVIDEINRSHGQEGSGTQ